MEPIISIRQPKNYKFKEASEKLEQMLKLTISTTDRQKDMHSNACQIIKSILRLVVDYDQLELNSGVTRISEKSYAGTSAIIQNVLILKGVNTENGEQQHILSWRMEEGNIMDGIRISEDMALSRTTVHMYRNGRIIYSL